MFRRAGERVPTRSVSDGFEEFRRRLTTSTAETEAAKSHRASIEACLKNNFGLLRFFRSGSFGNGTNVRSYSDVDYFASLPSVSSNSSSTLGAMASALRARFPTTYGIRVDSPAVVVPFGTDASEAHEIIPAKLTDSGDPRMYRIPDGSGGWMNSSPRAQDEYVSKIDDQTGRKTKPLIRFLKAWKYFNDVPVSSFYLEMVAAKHAAAASPIIYSWDLRDIFAKLKNSGLAALDDPAGASGKIPACRTSRQTEEAQSKVATAARRSVEAKKDEDAGKTGDAFAWWNLLFNYNFPSRFY